MGCRSFRLRGVTDGTGIRLRFGRRGRHRAVSRGNGPAGVPILSGCPFTRFDIRGSQGSQGLIGLHDRAMFSGNSLNLSWRRKSGGYGDRGGLKRERSLGGLATANETQAYPEAEQEPVAGRDRLHGRLGPDGFRNVFQRRGVRCGSETSAPRRSGPYRRWKHPSRRRVRGEDVSFRQWHPLARSGKAARVGIDFPSACGG